MLANMGSKGDPMATPSICSSLNKLVAGKIMKVTCVVEKIVGDGFNGFNKSNIGE